MIKKPWIRFRTKRNERARTSLEPVGFVAATRIGIIFSDNAASNQENIDKIIEDLIPEGKEICTLAFCKNKKKSNQNYPLFDARDIGVFGELKSEEIKSFVQQDFDFVICLDKETNYLIDFILATVKANCRIGISSATSPSRHFEMIIKPEREITSKEILKYLKMIQTNEH